MEASELEGLYGRMHDVLMRFVAQATLLGMTYGGITHTFKGSNGGPALDADTLEPIERAEYDRRYNKYYGVHRRKQIMVNETGVPECVDDA